MRGAGTGGGGWIGSARVGSDRIGWWWDRRGKEEGGETCSSISQPSARAHDSDTAIHTAARRKQRQTAADRPDRADRLAAAVLPNRAGQWTACRLPVIVPHPVPRCVCVCVCVSCWMCVCLRSMRRAVGSAVRWANRWPVQTSSSAWSGLTFSGSLRCAPPSSGLAFSAALRSRRAALTHSLAHSLACRSSSHTTATVAATVAVWPLQGREGGAVACSAQVRGEVRLACL